MVHTVSSDNQNTKCVIKAAFISLYASKNVRKITINELAKVAHVSRGTFYNYYSDIFELLYEIEDELISGINATMPNVILCTVSHSQQKKFCTEYVRFLHYVKENCAFFSALLFGSESSHFELKYQKFMESTFSVTLGMNMTYLKELIPYTCVFYCSAILGIVKRWIVTDFELAEEKLALLVYQVLFHGTYKSILPPAD